MTILKSLETQVLLNEKESNTVTFTFPVNDSFLEKSDSFHKEYFRKHIFGELSGQIDAIYYGNYDEKNNRVLKVEFTITKKLVQELIELENAAPEVDLHALLMNGAIEILEPLSETKLNSLAPLQLLTFMVAETSGFFQNSLEQQREAISRRIFGHGIFADADYEIHPELLKSPTKSIYYVRIIVKDFDKQVKKYLRKVELLSIILNDIRTDYPEYNFLPTNYTDKTIDVLSNSPSYVNERSYAVHCLIEVDKEDLDVYENFTLEEVIQEYIYYSIAHPREVPVKYIPLGVNPLTNGTIFKVDGLIRF